MLQPRQNSCHTTQESRVGLASFRKGAKTYFSAIGRVIDSKWARGGALAFRSAFHIRVQRRPICKLYSLAGLVGHMNERESEHPAFPFKFTQVHSSSYPIVTGSAEPGLAPAEVGGQRTAEPTFPLHVCVAVQSEQRWTEDR